MRIRWLQQAVDDLDNVGRFIETEAPSAASAVVARILDAVSLLEEQPGIGRPGRVPGTKELVIRSLPYIVPYRVKDRTVQILRVFRTSRKWPSPLRLRRVNRKSSFA